MFIKKVVGKEDLPLHDPVPRMTENQLHREIYYIRAEQLARKFELHANLIIKHGNLLFTFL